MKAIIITALALFVGGIGAMNHKTIEQAPEEQITYPENIEGCVHFVNTKNMEAYRRINCDTEKVNSYILNVKSGVQIK